MADKKRAVRLKQRPAPRSRSPDLTLQTVGDVVSFINDQVGKLTWDDVCKDLLNKTGYRYTRQALSRYITIQLAFTSSKNRNNKPIKKRGVSRADAKVEALQRKVSEAEAVRDFLIEKLVRWSFNANTRNLTEEFLDQPLPPISRAGKSQ